MLATLVPFSKALATCSSMWKREFPTCLRSAWVMVCSCSSHLAVLLSIQKLMLQTIITTPPYQPAFYQIITISTTNHPEYHRSKMNSSIITDVLKPSFLLSEERDSNKNNASRIESTVDYSKFNFTEELTRRMTFIDCNPFFKSSEVHLKPLPYPEQPYPKTFFMSSTEENNQHMNQSFVSEFIPVTESFLRQERSSSLDPARQTYQYTQTANNHTDDRQRQARIKEILAQIDKSSDLFRGHKAEEQKYEEYRDRNQQMYLRNIMELAHYEEQKRASVEEENHYQPATHDHGINRTGQAYSIINKLSEEHQYPPKESSGRFNFGTGEAQQEEAEDNDPTRFWKKDESEYDTGSWPTGVPPSIIVKGVTYELVPVL